MDAVTNVARTRRSLRTVDSDEGIPPPHSNDAEVEVLGHVLAAPEKLSAIPDSLRPEHFYSGGHGRIYEAMRICEDTDRSSSHVNVLEVLRTLGHHAQCADLVVDVLRDAKGTGSPRLLLEHAELIVELSRRRDLVDICRKTGAELQHGRLSADEAGARLASSTEADSEVGAAAAPRSPIIWAGELGKPLPPVEWICSALRIAKGGRPNVIAGENGGFKSFLASAILLCLTSDRKLFGRWEMAEGLRGLDLDYEQGPILSRRRYQRQARAMGFELGVVGQRLGYAFRPFLWNAPDARERLLRLCEGIDVVKVDPISACTSGIDENSSAARSPMDLAIDVSHEMGTTFLFVDHSGKPPGDGSQRKRKHAQRGHSSKTDASQTQIILSREKGEPALVTCERDQVSGAYFPDFKMNVADVMSEDGTDPQWGLRLDLVDPEIVPKQAGDKFDRLKESIVRLVLTTPTLTSRNAICARVDGANKTDKLTAIDELMADGRLSGGEGTAFRARS